MKHAITSVAEETIGFVKSKQKDWFDEHNHEISQLKNRKRLTRITYEAHPTPALIQAFAESRMIYQRRLRDLQNNWWTTKAEKLQRYADQRDMRGFFMATKELYGPRRPFPDKLQVATGEVTHEDPTDILNRWKKHFESLLNDHAHTEDDLLQHIPQHNLPLR